MPLNFKEVFDTYVENNQKEWEHDRSKTVGASEIFKCLRQVGYEKRAEEFGIEPDEDYEGGWGALIRGDLIENFFVEPAIKGFLPDGMKLLMAGSKQKTLVSGKNSATPDGLIVNCPADVLKDYGVDDIESDCIALEIKSIDPRSTLEEEKALHRGQAQVQMGLFRKLTKYKPNYSIILYVNASFLDDITIFVVKYDPKVMKVARQRAPMVWEVDDPMELPPEGKFDGGCQYCRWTKACGQATKDAFPTGTAPLNLDEDDNLSEYKDLLIECDKLKEESKAAEKNYKEKQEEVKQLLRDNNTKKAEGETQDQILKTSMAWIKGRKSYDFKSMKDDGINIEEYETEGNGYERLTITVKNKKE